MTAIVTHGDSSFVFDCDWVISDDRGSDLTIGGAKSWDSDEDAESGDVSVVCCFADIPQADESTVIASDDDLQAEGSTAIALIDMGDIGVALT